MSAFVLKSKTNYPNIAIYARDSASAIAAIPLEKRKQGRGRGGLNNAPEPIPHLPEVPEVPELPDPIDPAHVDAPADLNAPTAGKKQKGKNN
jgi:hypothetical protein